MNTAPACRVRRLTLDGENAIRVDNGIIQADILPQRGGKIWNLLHLSSSTQWIWHNPQALTREIKPGSSYDDNWAGGWEELFPNDAACVFQGRTLPDHGNWWSRSWKSEIVKSPDGRVAVRMSSTGGELNVRCAKIIELNPGASSLTIRYRIKNSESAPISFLFKQHLAVAVTPAHRLELPGGRMTPVDLSFSTRLGGAGPYAWPHGLSKSSRPVDMSVLPDPEEGHKEFIYVEDLPEGWCGVRDLSSGRSLRLGFSRETFPYTWLFATYGGWRGLYTVVLEPCTNMPKDLNEAFRLGRCARLEPKASFETSVSATLA